MALIMKDANGLVSLANKSDKWAVYNTKAAAEEALANDELAEGMIVGVVSTTETPYNPDYSTAEINTGAKWIDGKPIYRKCYYNATNWANNAIVDTISDIGFVVQIRDITTAEDSQCYDSFSDNINIAKTYVRNGVLTARRSGVFANQSPSAIIIEYTKTGD